LAEKADGLMNYYQRHIGDYARDTGHLTLLEHGVYGTLLDWQYATEKALPSELSAVQRICRATTRIEKNAVERIRNEFFDAAGWNARTKREVDACRKVSMQKSVGALKMHHPELAGMTHEHVLEWAKAHGYALDEQKRCTTTRARSKTPRRQDAKIEGGVAPAVAALCQVSDTEVLAWAADWPGEMASGTPKMNPTWVKLKLVQLNGRREWPGNWQRWLVACWRGEHRSFSAGEQNLVQKKNAAGPLSASVEEISRQKKIAALSDEEDSLAYDVNSIRANNIEVPPEKLERLRLVREELKKLRV
jgi:uncharacterized protein YdaU (DUF1376 family)